MNQYSLRAKLLPLAALAAMLMPVSHAIAQLGGPFIKQHLYSEIANANMDISAAIRQATRENKRILLEFGGDWCGDCQVLEIYFHQPPNEALLTKHFIVVHIDIGQMDHNVAIAKRYQVPIEKGVPAFAVLDSHGRLLFSQKNKEGETMSRMDAGAVTQFLNKWKG
jgi:thiol:disulfide interchange protein